MEILTKAIKGTKLQRVEERHKPKENTEFAIPEELLKDPDFQLALVRFYCSAEEMDRLILSQDLKMEPGAKKLQQVELTPQ